MRSAWCGVRRKSQTTRGQNKLKRGLFIVVLLGVATIVATAAWKDVNADGQANISEQAAQYPYDRNFSTELVKAALERTKHSVTYDGSYRKIAYPGGDVPDNIGVCSDVVIRVYRQVGIDLQKEIHEDMKGNFSFYSKRWGLKKTDTNIDHRRVHEAVVTACRPTPQPRKQ